MKVHLPYDPNEFNTPEYVFGMRRGHFSSDLFGGHYRLGCINDDQDIKDFRRLYNKTVLLYSLRTTRAPKGNWLRRWRQDLFNEWALHGTKPLSEDRFLYQPAKYPGKAILDHLDDFIEKHLELCNILESRIAEMPELQKRRMLRGDPWGYHLGDGEVHDPIMVLPTCRAVALLHDMEAQLPLEHTTALVLTGDYEGMVSGPVTFETIKDEVIAGRCDDPRVAFVPLATAVKFLRDLEDREIAVNTSWQDHNRRCLEKPGNLLLSSYTPSQG